LILYDGKYWAISGTSGTGVYRSMNGGQSWTQYNTGLGEVDVFLLEEFHAAGTRLYLGTGLDLYGIDGTTLAVPDEASVLEASIYPTLFSDGFTVELGSGSIGATLVLIDAMGREVLHHVVNSIGKVRVERGALGSGAYRVMLMPLNGARTSHLGTVIAD